MNEQMVRNLDLKATAVEIGGTIMVSITLGEEIIFYYQPGTGHHDLALRDAEDKLAKVLRYMLINAFPDSLTRFYPIVGPALPG